MSGYDRGLLVPTEDEREGILFLEKPFTYDALLAKIAALMALHGGKGGSIPQAKLA